MSDRTHQALANIVYEVIAVTVDQLAFYQRLHALNPDLVSASDIRVIQQRLQRLRTMFKALQQEE